MSEKTYRESSPQVKIGEKLKAVMAEFKPTKVLSVTKPCEAVHAKEPTDNSRTFSFMRSGRGGME